MILTKKKQTNDRVRYEVAKYLLLLICNRVKLAQDTLEVTYKPCVRKLQ